MEERDVRPGLEGNPEHKFTRRSFLAVAAPLALSLEEEVRRYWRSGPNTAMAKTEKAIEPQIDLPSETYLTSQPEWFLRLVRQIPVGVLKLYNGPQEKWSSSEGDGLFLVPNSYFGGRDGVDSFAKEALTKRVIFRVDVGRNEKTDEGWTADEQALIQALMYPAVRRNIEFFGESRFKGFVRVSRPGEERKKLIQNQLRDYQEPAGAVVGGSKPGTLQVLILTSLAEFAEQRKGVTAEAISDEYVRMMRDLLTHEIGHVWLLGTKLGSLDNHNIVRTAGASINLIDLLDKSPEVKKPNVIVDLDRPEMLLWKAFKVRGHEFYVELIEWLVARYGEKTEYSDDEVRGLANALFKGRARFDFTYDQLLEAYGKVPDEKAILTRPMQDYHFPIEKVAGDQYNPDGNVSWWVEAKSLAPISVGTSRKWVNMPNQVFPDENGYYTVYKFIDNGKLKDGPPGGNSLAVATWMRGGSLSGSDWLFPVGMSGVEIIRAVKNT